MKADFWGTVSDEYLKNNPEPPPLTDESLAAFETRVGLKLPKSLTDLLRVKNGGLIQNTDFKFKGKEYEVTYFKSVTDNSYDSIRPYSSILEDPEWAEMRKPLHEKTGDLSKVLLVAEPNGYPYAFALNYNHLNSTAGPTVYCVWMDGDEADANHIANSFAEFLAGQHFGDKHPIVDLKEAAKYRLVAEGGYDGRYEGTPDPESGALSGLPARVRWKICSHRSRLIIFQDVYWGGELEIKREVIHKSALTFDFPSLESYGVELEPEFANIIRPAIEMDALSKYEAPLIPDCFILLLHIQPGHKKWVSIDSSSPHQGNWKNRSDKVVSSSVLGASKSELRKVMKAVADSCSGLRRWLG